jgi:hypothetical protein
MGFLLQKNKSTSSLLDSGFVKSKSLISNRPNIYDNQNVALKNESSENKSRLSFQNIPIQPKLKISKPDDPYEKEADRVAEKIMKMPLTTSETISSKKDQDALHRKCSKCEMENEEKLDIHRQVQSSSSTYLEPPNEIEQKIDPIKMSQGSPLDSSTREFMEPRFGFNFDDVRIHTDSNASKANASINARAFAMGNDIYFNDGEYDPKTTKGRTLLAHELTHVVQQTSPQKTLGFETNTLNTSMFGNNSSELILENDVSYREFVVNSSEYLSVLHLTPDSSILLPSWSCGWEEADYWASVVGLAAGVAAAVIAIAGAVAPEPTVTKAAAILAAVAALGLLYNFIRAARNLKHCYETDPDADRREIERLNQELQEYQERTRELEEGLQRVRDLVE